LGKWLKKGGWLEFRGCRNGGWLQHKEEVGNPKKKIEENRERRN
jgi:hypothetical protein